MSENDVNEPRVLGTLDETPELRTTRGGTKVANPTIITTRSYTDRSGQERTATEYHRVVCWAGLAEKAANTPDEARVEVTGRLQTRSWKDSDGCKRTSTEIVAGSFKVVATDDDFDEEALLGTDDDLPF